MHRLSSGFALACTLALVACGTSPSTSDAGGVDAPDALAPDAASPDAYVVPRTRAMPLSCAPATGAPHDVLPLARIEADQTRVGLVWVREDRDGPETLRDDDGANGWAPTPGVIATLRIDLGPGAQRPVALDALTITTSGPAFADVHAYVLEACGGGVVADFAWDDPTQPLSLAGTCGACVELDVRGARDSRVLSASLTSRDDTIVLPALPDAPAAPPTPAFAESGVIEGFYGPPWSWSERARVIDAMSELGLGAYLYAPKDDPLHRSMWRVPYDADAIARFGTLAARARASGVQFLFGVSPFLDFHADVDADYDALARKLGTLLDAGASGIAILADDLGVVTIDAALGAQQAAVVSRVLDALAPAHPGVTVWFVPTVYDDAILAGAPQGTEYLMALRALPPEVRILWTGLDTGSATLTGADLLSLRFLIDRDPLIWDNEWANDAGDGFAGHLLLGTYEGRDGALRMVTHGIAANPMIEGGLSRMPAALLAAWLAHDETGDAARARAAALELRYAWRSDADAQARATDALVRLMEAHDGVFTSVPTHRRLAAALDAITMALARGEAPRATDMATALDVFAGLATLASSVHHSALDAELADELVFPLASLREQGLAGLALLDAITARFGNTDASEAEARARAHLDAAGHVSRFQWAPHLLDDAITAIGAMPARDLGLRAPTHGTPVPPPCVVGVDASIDGFAAGATAYGPLFSSHGPATYAPLHPGAFDAVLTAQDPSGGVASYAFSIACVPPR
jgi:hypothetical protein